MLAQLQDNWQSSGHDRHRLPHHLRSWERDCPGNDLDDLLSESKAKGRNLNQLTTLANMGRISVLQGDDLVHEYTKLCDRLGTLVREMR